MTKNNRLFYIILITFILIFLVGVLFSCGPKDLPSRGVLLIFNANAPDAYFETKDKKTMTIPTQVNSEFKKASIDPTRPEYVFDGWYLDAECNVPVKSNFITKKTTIIYAKWVSVKVYPHIIIINDIQNGRVSIDNENNRAKYSERVVLSIYPDEGYEVDENSIGYYDDKDRFYKVTEKNNFGSYYFNMPPSQVKIVVGFIKMKYLINVIHNDKNEIDSCDVFLSTKTAEFGQTVRFAVIPNYGYRVKSIISNAERIEDRFIMPKSNVTITVETVKIDTDTKFDINVVDNDKLNCYLPQKAPAGVYVPIDVKAKDNYYISNIIIDDIKHDSLGFIMPEKSVKIVFETKAIDKNNKYPLILTSNASDNLLEILDINNEYYAGQQIMPIIKDNNYIIESIFLNGKAVPFNNIFMPEMKSTISIYLTKRKEINLDYNSFEGKVFLSCNTYISNIDYKLYVKAEPGYKILEVKLNGENFELSSSEQFNDYYVFNISQDKTSIDMSFVIAFTKENVKSGEIIVEGDESAEIIDKNAIPNKVYENQIINLPIISKNIHMIESIKYQYGGGDEVELKQNNSKYMFIYSPPTDSLENGNVVLKINKSSSKFYDITINNTCKGIAVVAGSNKIEHGKNVEFKVYQADNSVKYTIKINGNPVVFSNNMYTEDNVVQNLVVEVFTEKLPEIQAVEIIFSTNPIGLENLLEKTKNANEGSLLHVEISDVNKKYYSIKSISIRYFKPENINQEVKEIRSQCFEVPKVASQSKINVVVDIEEKVNLVKNFEDIYNTVGNSQYISSVQIVKSIAQKNETFNPFNKIDIEFLINYIETGMIITTKLNDKIYLIETNKIHISNEILQSIKLALDEKHGKKSDAFIHNKYLIISYHASAKEDYIAISNGIKFNETSKLFYYEHGDGNVGIFGYISSNNYVIIPNDIDNKHISTLNLSESIKEINVVKNYI